MSVAYAEGLDSSKRWIGRSTRRRRPGFEVRRGLADGGRGEGRGRGRGTRTRQGREGEARTQLVAMASRSTDARRDARSALEDSESLWVTGSDSKLNARSTLTVCCIFRVGTIAKELCMSNMLSQSRTRSTKRGALQSSKIDTQRQVSLNRSCTLA